MASKALKLGVKAEAAELGEQAGIAVPVKMQHGKYATTVRTMTNEDNLLEVPASKATLADFPPGCPVLYTDTSVVPVLVSKGKIESVFVDLTPGLVPQYLYKISLESQKNSIMAGEMQLQWAPQCPVWVKPLQVAPWKRAIIRGSYQANANAVPQYSLQEVEPDTGLFHGLTRDCIHYRSVDDDICNETSTFVKESAPLALLETHSQVQTPAHKKSDSDVPCVTASPRKRPASSGKSAADDPAMGRCSAEFRMPIWMKTLCPDGMCAYLYG